MKTTRRDVKRKNEREREKFGAGRNVPLAGPLPIVHYHRLSVIDHLAVGLIDAARSKEPVALARARARARFPSSGAALPD